MLNKYTKLLKNNKYLNSKVTIDLRKTHIHTHTFCIAYI